MRIVNRNPSKQVWGSWERRKSVSHWELSLYTPDSYAVRLIHTALEPSILGKMRTSKNISFIVLLFGLTGKILAQDLTIHPYVGASGNFFGVSDGGWGVEFGLRYDNFYIGTEYGNYSSGGYKKSDFTSDLFFPPPLESEYYYEDPHLPTTREHYLGLSAGLIIKNTFWLGYEALVSNQSSIHPVMQNFQGYRWMTTTLYWFDVGPDIRIEGWNHLLLNLSYSNRRGVKCGVGYIL